LLLVLIAQGKGERKKRVGYNGWGDKNFMLAAFYVQCTRWTTHTHTHTFREKRTRTHTKLILKVKKLPAWVKIRPRRRRSRGAVEKRF